MCDELVRELAAVAVQIIDLGKGRRRGDMPERLEPSFDLGPLPYSDFMRRRPRRKIALLAKELGDHAREICHRKRDPVLPSCQSY